MIPVARTENLLLQDIGNELIIYDQNNNSSHCLTPLAVRVWELSNGQNTVNDIADKLEKEFNLSADSDVDMRGLVWLTLEELERYSLIKEYLRQPATNVIAGMSRRKAIKTATLVGGFAISSMFPMVKSVAVADPGGHVSTSHPPKPPEESKGCPKLPCVYDYKPDIDRDEAGNDIYCCKEHPKCVQLPATTLKVCQKE